MSRYIRSTSKNKLYYRIPPIFIHTSNHNLPGRRLGRRRPPAVGWSYLPIITWLLLLPNSSPTGAGTRMTNHSGLCCSNSNGGSKSSSPGACPADQRSCCSDLQLRSSWRTGKTMAASTIVFCCYAISNGQSM